MQDNRWQQKEEKSFPHKVNDELRRFFRWSANTRDRYANKLIHWKTEYQYFFWICFWLTTVSTIAVCIALVALFNAINFSFGCFVVAFLGVAAFVLSLLTVAMIETEFCNCGQHQKDLR